MKALSRDRIYGTAAEGNLLSQIVAVPVLSELALLPVRFTLRTLDKEGDAWRV